MKLDEVENKLINNNENDFDNNDENNDNNSDDNSEDNGPDNGPDTLTWDDDSDSMSMRNELHFVRNSFEDDDRITDLGRKLIGLYNVYFTPIARTMDERKRIANEIVNDKRTIVTDYDLFINDFLSELFFGPIMIHFEPESKPTADTKTSEVKVDAKSTEVKPLDTKADGKSVETKSVESKSDKNIPVDAKPIDAKPIDAKPIDAKPSVEPTVPAVPTLPTEAVKPPSPKKSIPDPKEDKASTALPTKTPATLSDIKRGTMVGGGDGVTADTKFGNLPKSLWSSLKEGDWPTGTLVKSDATIGNNNVTLGENVFIGEKAVIEDNVIISPMVDVPANTRVLANTFVIDELDTIQLLAILENLRNSTAVDPKTLQSKVDALLQETE